MRATLILRSFIAAGFCLGLAHNAYADGMTSMPGTSLPVGSGDSYYILVGPGDLISIVDPQAVPPSPTPAWIAAHQTAFINAHTGQNSFVPSGAVMAFDLPTCPVGWAPLAGAEGRGIIGTGAYSETSPGSNPQPFTTSYNVGDTGGSAYQSLQIQEMPKHTHPIRFTGNPDNGDPASVWAMDVSHQGYIEWDTTFISENMYAGGGGAPFEQPAVDNDDHSTLVADGDGAGPFTSALDAGGTPSLPEGQAQPFDKRVPYLALLYCKKQ